MSAESQSEIEALNEMLEQLDPDSRSLAAEYDMGDQAEEFMNSDLGRYMIGSAHQDLHEAHIKLAKTFPAVAERDQVRGTVRSVPARPDYSRQSRRTSTGAKR